MKTGFLISLIATMAFSSQEVFITRTGTKYHTHNDCRYLKNSRTVTKTSKEQAEKDGKTICSWCYSKDHK